MDPFIAEIKLLPYTFAPMDWAFCNGQLMLIQQNMALFSLVGTTFGGNGTTTFGLPNLQGRAPMHPGYGPGLSVHTLGETGGAETVTLSGTQVPPRQHSHSVMAATGTGNATNPSGAILANSGARTPIYVSAPADTPLNAGAVGQASASGGGLPHNNMMPYLALNFCIATAGIYPQRP